MAYVPNNFAGNPVDRTGRLENIVDTSVSVPVQKKQYVVALPDVSLSDLPHYDRVGKYGTIEAFSPAQAVSQYVMRETKGKNIGEPYACMILARLKEDFSGLDFYAFEPALGETPSKLSEEDRYFMLRHGVAAQLQDRDPRPHRRDKNHYLGIADQLLQEFHTLR